MDNKYSFAESSQINKRKIYAEKFYNTILDPEEIPYIVTDEACLYDFFTGDEFKLIHQIKQKYGIDVNKEHFKMPFWKLLDLLEQLQNNS